MPGPESVRGYLDAVEAQIRWKRARTVAARELETHLEDQQEEFLAEGHPPEEAERLAVEDMGDPVAVGADLDRLHRPRPQWGMLGLTLALLLVGGWLRYALTRAGAPWDEDLDPLRCALSVVTGAAVLVGAYFLDVSRLLRWAKWVYIGAVMASAEMKNLKMKSARAALDLSQQQLADLVGVSRQTINAIEKGDYNPTIRLCIAICRALNRTLDDLFWEES